MKASALPPGFHPVRHDRLLQEQVHDSYRSRGKLPEPTVCPECKAVFHQGHWQWRAWPAQAHQTLCPACLRIKDDYPAGYLSLSGPFFMGHRTEIMRLVSHEAQRAYQTHPLQRIMKAENTSASTQITTTDIHLARALGEAIHDAYQGRLDYHYNPEQALLRVTWEH